MKNRPLIYLFLAGFIICIFTPSAYCQLDQLHGDQVYSAYGLHSGNQIRTHFWNDGQIGVRRYASDQIGGEWPIGSGNQYLSKIATFIGSEVVDTNGELQHIVSESNGTRAGMISFTAGDYDEESGLWWCFSPLPGFHNPNPSADYSDNPQIAMSNKPWSWPDVWPDKMEDPEDPGWAGAWNGYYGKNILAADQESFYMTDDYNNREFSFYPDSQDSNRRGLGLRVSVRGMQWTYILLEDIFIMLFDFENVGTHYHSKMCAGIQSGYDIGGGGDSSDDGVLYNMDEELDIFYDGDGVGGSSHTGSVGFAGLTLLETPENIVDGIDGDGDGASGSGGLISVDMFEPKNINVGDQIIVINYETNERNITTMPAGGVTFTFAEKEYQIRPGIVTEIAYNLIDDNLNGLIDENNGYEIGEGDDAITRYKYEGKKYIDYFTGAGLDNLMIDEKRDDGIDNDGDWNPLEDDLGLDGLPNTGDPGEGDGIPTSGTGTAYQGEPNIDKRDLDEVEMVGTTSAIIYTELDYYSLQEDEHLWESMIPGTMEFSLDIGNIESILSAGYFPLKPTESKRFTIGYLMGYPESDVFANKEAAESILRGNYLTNTRVPDPPVLKAVAGNRTVTLTWDTSAESSFDPLNGYDFEGYRVYRSTNPGDLFVLSGSGSDEEGAQPVAIYDLNNGIKGYTETKINGVSFYLGDDTGLQYSYTDTNLVNGITYYYAVVSYDRGSDSLGIYPMECYKSISINNDGEIIEHSQNVAAVTPLMPASGPKIPQIIQSWLPGSTAEGEIEFFLQKRDVEARTYYLTFEHEMVKQSTFWMVPETQNFSLTDVTNPDTPVLLIDRSTGFGEFITIPDFDVFRFMAPTKREFGVVAEKSGWIGANIYSFAFRLAYFGKYRLGGQSRPCDYRIEIGEPGCNQSIEALTFPAIPVNIRVFNITYNQEIKFAFEARDGSDGKFSGFTDNNSKSDRLYFFEKEENDSLVLTYHFELSKTNADSLARNPEEGNVCYIKQDRPYMNHDILEIKTIPPSVGIKDDVTAEFKDFHLAQNFPNPFNPDTQINYTLPRKCPVQLTIYNIQGQRIRILVNREETEGYHSVIWNGANQQGLSVASGVYFYHLEAGDFSQVKRMVMLK